MAHVGVDEAGKGPAIGPMLVAAVRGPVDAVRDATDSKTIAPDRRASLAARFRADPRIAISVVAVPVALIDDPATDMNGLGCAAHAAAAGGVVRDGDRVLCDAADTNADRFARRVKAALPKQRDGGASVAVEASHGADASDPVVGAASVVAKVERDAWIDRLADRYGAIGSGYPNDGTTRSFLADWVADEGALPPFARSSWATCRDVLAAAEQTAVDAF